MSGHEATELELCRRMVAGDSAATEELERRIRKCIVHVIKKEGAFELWPEVADMTSEVKARLHKYLEGFQGNDEQYRTYLYQVVSSVCTAQSSLLIKELLNLEDDGQTLTEKVIPAPARSKSREVTFPPNPAEDMVLSEEEQAEIETAIGVLSSDCQDLLSLFHQEELTIKEIAAQTGLPEGTITGNLKRCREKTWFALLTLYVDGGDREKKQFICSLVEQLPLEEREVFSMWWLEGSNYTQMSERLGEDKGWVRERLARAKLMLWSLVQEKGP